jgi:NTE family protein
MQHETTVLVLQGGGALGAYQAGAYEGLAEARLAPDWVAGISIGAINAAIIAGNSPLNRVGQLRKFWETVSSGLQGHSVLPGDQGRSYFNEISSWLTTLYGVPGFFTPRFPSPAFAMPGTANAMSFYDTTPLHATLEELVDFKLLNTNGMRCCVGTVNVKSGNFRYFDTAKDTIDVRHIMASGALPPGFAPVEIDGQFYWDGGLVSNTPLQYVLDQPRTNGGLCIFQVDLFSARGEMPKTILEAAEREKEIRYSSRTRMNTDVVVENQRLRAAAKRLAEKLPAELRDDVDAKFLLEAAPDTPVTLVHLIKRPTSHDTQSKDYEFSRLTIEENWQAGLADVRKSLNHSRWKDRSVKKGMETLDLTKEPAA